MSTRDDIMNLLTFLTEYKKRIDMINYDDEYKRTWLKQINDVIELNYSLNESNVNSVNSSFIGNKDNNFSNKNSSRY